MIDAPLPEHQALEAFIEAMQTHHGMDLSGYARASLQRRVEQLALRDGHASIEALVKAIRRGGTSLPALVAGLSVPVTESYHL